jgi:CDP-diacylglycerol--serine O-phosphatidyltransferase
MSGALAHALTAGRVLFGAAAIDAAATGRLTLAASFITASAVLDGLDGKAARWTETTSPFGALFDYFCDYLCFIVAPWELTRALLPATSPPVSLALALPLVTGAARYARSGVLVATERDEVRDLPGLATVFYTFVSVVAVFLEVPSYVTAPQLTALVTVATVTFSLLMIVPIRYPKLSHFRGASPAVLTLLVAMPLGGTKLIAAAALVIGLVYVVCGPFAFRGKAPSWRR